LGLVYGPSRIDLWQLFPAAPQLFPAPHQLFVISQLPLLEYTKGKLGFFVDFFNSDQILLSLIF